MRTVSNGIMRWRGGGGVAGASQVVLRLNWCHGDRHWERAVIPLCSLVFDEVPYTRRLASKSTTAIRRAAEAETRPVDSPR